MTNTAGFEQRMIYEAGQATGGIDLELLKQRQNDALENIHSWEYTHALIGLAIALAENNDRHKDYWISSLQSIGTGAWLKGHDPDSTPMGLSFSKAPA